MLLQFGSWYFAENIPVPYLTPQIVHIWWWLIVQTSSMTSGPNNLMEIFICRTIFLCHWSTALSRRDFCQKHLLDMVCWISWSLCQMVWYIRGALISSKYFQEIWINFVFTFTFAMTTVLIIRNNKEFTEKLRLICAQLQNHRSFDFETAI